MILYTEIKIVADKLIDIQQEVNDYIKNGYQLKDGMIQSNDLVYWCFLFKDNQNKK